MRKELIAFISVAVLGFAGLLSTVCAQTSISTSRPLENDTYEAFITALTQHEQKMESLQAQFDATLPHMGPWTDYQLRLLDQLNAPRPTRVLQSIHQCMSGGSGGNVSLESLLNAASIIQYRDREVKHFYAKTGWRFLRPTASNHSGVIRFEGTVADSGRHATADLEDLKKEGDWAPHGFIGSGRYTVGCTGPSGSYSQNWRWSLFRDLPPQ